MSFRFRSAEQITAFPAPMEATGFRADSLHAANTVEATDHFLRKQREHRNRNKRKRVPPNQSFAR